MWVDDVIRFWFEELAQAHWFKKSDATDEAIRGRFLPVHGELMAQGGQLDSANPLAMIAGIIVLDQFSRNMFRGTPRAFASDPIALRIARDPFPALAPAIRKPTDHEVRQMR